MTSGLTLWILSEKKKMINDNDDEQDDGQFITNDEDDFNDDPDSGELISEDPLGQKKRNEVRRCIDAFNRKKKAFGELRTNNDIIDTYYQFSPNIVGENFNATNFLVEIHNETDFDGLQN